MIIRKFGNFRHSRFDCGLNQKLLLVRRWGRHNSFDRRHRVVAESVQCCFPFPPVLVVWHRSKQRKQASAGSRRIIVVVNLSLPPVSFSSIIIQDQKLHSTPLCGVTVQALIQSLEEDPSKQTPNTYIPDNRH